MSHGPPWVLRARGLAKRYGTVDAVKDLDLSVRQGEVYGFLGPNGAGKTTTLLMLLGIERPTAGLIELFGEPGPPDPLRKKQRIGVVGEAQYLYDDLSAWEYLQFFGRLYGVAGADRRAHDLLERLDLLEFRRLRARDFSRGMQQKLGLARALLHRPPLLVLDEPVSGLDPHGIRQVREVLAEERDRGATILMSSHILSEVERIADRVGILFGGRLVAEDTVDRLAVHLQPEPLLALDVEQVGAGVLDLLRALPFVRDAELVPDEARARCGVLRVRVDGTSDHRRAVSALIAGQGGLITAMREERLNLEEAFVRLTTDGVPSARDAVGPLGPGAAPPVAPLASGSLTLGSRLPHGPLTPRPPLPHEPLTPQPPLPHAGEGETAAGRPALRATNGAAGVDGGGGAAAADGRPVGSAVRDAGAPNVSAGGSPVGSAVRDAGTPELPATAPTAGGAAAPDPVTTVASAAEGGATDLPATDASAAEGRAPHVPTTDLSSVEAGVPEASMPRLEGVPDDERAGPSAAGFAQASRRSGSMGVPVGARAGGVVDGARAGGVVDGARGGGAVAGDKAGGVVDGARSRGVVDGALSAASVHADRRAHRRVVWAIARRDLLAMLYGPSIYVVVALGMLAALPVMASHLDAIERNRVLILADAFTLPFFVAATLAMLFLAFASVATIARERDQGTLEVLFYGPVSVGAYVLAKHLAQILAFVPIVGALGLLLLAYSGMTGFRLPAAFGLELLLSLCTAAAVAALGICISALARGVRAGVGLLLGLALLFLAIIGTDDVLSALPVRDNVSPLLFARTIAHWLSTAVSYVSPFGLFQAGIDALVQQDLVGYLGAVALSLLHCALLLTAAARLLDRRGVRR